MTDERLQPSDTEGVRLLIGHLVAPHGLRGEFRMHISTHFPERIPELRHVYVGDEDSPRALRRARLQGNVAIMRVDGLSTREQVDEMRGTPIRIDLSQAAPLDEDEFFHYQIIGLRVYDEAGTHLGEVAEIIETGANDVYIVKDDAGKQTLIPALRTAVLEIDPSEGRMLVRLPRYADES
jgi:16S rRNA processing protein RimM